MSFLQKKYVENKAPLMPIPRGFVGKDYLIKQHGKWA